MIFFTPFFFIASFTVFQLADAQGRKKSPPPEDYDRDGLPALHAPCKVDDLPQGEVENESFTGSDCKYVSVTPTGARFKWYPQSTIASRTCCVKQKCEAPFDKYFCKNTYKTFRGTIDTGSIGTLDGWAAGGYFEHNKCPEFGEGVECWVPDRPGHPGKVDPYGVHNIQTHPVDPASPGQNPFGPSSDSGGGQPSASTGEDPRTLDHGNNAESAVAQEYDPTLEAQGTPDRENNAGLTIAQGDIPYPEYNPIEIPASPTQEDPKDPEEEASIQGDLLQDSPLKARSLAGQNFESNGRNAVIKKRSRKVRSRFGE